MSRISRQKDSQHLHDLAAKDSEIQSLQSQHQLEINSLLEATQADNAALQDEHRNQLDAAKQDVRFTLEKAHRHNVEDLRESQKTELLELRKEHEQSHIELSNGKTEEFACFHVTRDELVEQAN